MVLAGGQWQPDYMLAEPQNDETSRQDCKGAARALAALIADGNTPSIPAPGRTEIGGPHGPRFVFVEPEARG